MKNTEFRSGSHVFLLIVFFLIVNSLQAQESKIIPNLTIPEITTENNLIWQWPEDLPVPNSIRAWHYNKDLVLPLMNVGQAVENSLLDYVTIMKLAMVISSKNDCFYCLCNAVGVLRQQGYSDSDMVALQTNLKDYKCDNKEKALLILAEQLTINPSTSGEYVKNAKKEGWTEEEIANTIFFISYLNMMNRIAVAFGLPPDDNHPYDPETKIPMLKCEEKK